MNTATLGVSLLIIGLIIGIGIGYVIHSGQQPQQTQMPQTQTQTYTKTYTTTTTTTKTQEKTIKEEYTIKLAYNPRIGLYLVDSKGMTLYFFAKDANGTSACQGQCIKNWPAFYVDKINPSPGLNKNDFSVITRSDGSKQLAYKGWPLYYFIKDKKPGDILGDGVKNVWYVAKPDYSVLAAYKEGLGLYLVDSKGMTLYFFAKDANGTSACQGQCIKNWPAFTPMPQTKFVIPSILNITDFNFIKRSDGTIQVVYKGHPLYYWINDHYRGDTTGHGVHGVWFVANIAGVIPSGK